MFQLELAKRCPDSWQNIISKCVLRWFLEEMHLHPQMSKEGPQHQCGQASSLMEARHKKKRHMIKARAHKGGVRIGKTPKKLASICCP
jgi:hypothetical protein